jgi:hypothetical protein
LNTVSLQNEVAAQGGSLYSTGTALFEPDNRLPYAADKHCYTVSLLKKEHSRESNPEASDVSYL